MSFEEKNYLDRTDLALFSGDNDPLEDEKLDLSYLDEDIEYPAESDLNPPPYGVDDSDWDDDSDPYESPNAYAHEYEIFESQDEGWYEDEDEEDYDNFFLYDDEAF